jgi:predicted dehydrogenase
MVKWGILGLGRAANSFAEAIKEVENAELVSIASLSKSKLKFFGNKYNIVKNLRFNTYDDLINNKEVDAVYIATLNNTHAELTIKLAESNKNILCEKPMALNESEAKQVFAELTKSKVLFLEAIAYRSHPQTKVLNKLILENEIGQIENIKSSFGFSARNFFKFIPKHRLFSKKLGGGAICDIGCYPSSFSLLIARLLQKKDQELKFDLENVTGKINFRGTDDEAHAKIIFKNQFEAELDVAITKKMENSIIISGSKGKMTIRDPWLPNKKVILEVVTKSNKYEKEIISKYSIYANSIKYASDLIEIKETKCEFPLMTLEDSMINMQILNKWKNALYKI